MIHIELYTRGDRSHGRESEIDIITEQKADLMLEIDSIGTPDKIKYVKGYQGNMMVTLGVRYNS